jgi:hypothetical protein
MIRITRLGVAGLLAMVTVVASASPAAAKVQPQDGKGDNATFLGTPCLNFRTGPHLNSGVVACVDYGHAGGIDFSTTGDWVKGLWGWTNCWDYVRYVQPDGTEVDGYASDGFVYTGKSEC